MEIDSVEITTKSYWEDYYRNSTLDRKVIESICGKYDHFWGKLVASCKPYPKSILEIGAFPGRYLAYLASKYNLSATGIDFNNDTNKVAEAMKAMGVSDYEYVHHDFLTHKPAKLYDIVYSNGFIEHFVNFDEVLDKHVEYLRPGGSLMILIPNKRYLRKIYGLACDYKNLKAHNLKCMNLKVFREFAKRNRLQIHYLSYDGGFPSKVHQPLNLIQKILYRVVRLASIKLYPILSKYPSKWYSGSIIAIFSKPID